MAEVNGSRTRAATSSETGTPNSGRPGGRWVLAGVRFESVAPNVVCLVCSLALCFAYGRVKVEAPVKVGAVFSPGAPVDVLVFRRVLVNEIAAGWVHLDFSR